MLLSGIRLDSGALDIWPGTGYLAFVLLSLFFYLVLLSGIQLDSGALDIWPDIGYPVSQICRKFGYSANLLFGTFLKIESINMFLSQSEMHGYMLPPCACKSFISTMACDSAIELHLFQNSSCTEHHKD